MLNTNLQCSIQCSIFKLTSFTINIDHKVASHPEPCVKKMKKTITSLVILTFLIEGCLPQKKISINTGVKMYRKNIPKITQEKETFDFNLFTKNSIPQLSTGETLISNESYEEYDSSHNLRRHFVRGVGGDGSIVGYDYTTNTLIGIYKEFYPDGKIKLKGVYCALRFKIGLWYQFDSSGNFVGTINYDDGYKFDYKGVFAFCNNHHISLEQKTSGYRTTINKFRSPGGKNCWFIQYPSEEPQVYINITLDGESGDILSTVESALPKDVD